MTDPFSVTVFTRHNLALHALLLENQPWFCARDLGRLMGFHLNDRVVSKLDEDQRKPPAQPPVIPYLHSPRCALQKRSTHETTHPTHCPAHILG
jgi:hypothetical protein